MTEVVFVSGATGFIAQHIVKDLIKSDYKVIGTVRNTEKGENLKRLLKSDNFQYEIVEDLRKENVFDKPLKKHPEATVFIHTASPVVFTGNDPEHDLLLPAINGTRAVMKAIKAYAPQIRKVVLTSSYAAINSLLSPRAVKSGTINEDTWTDLTYEEALQSHAHGYAGSKTFAERTAWDFLKNESPNFNLTTVNPVFVFGPQAFDENAKGLLNFSADVVTSFLKLHPNDSIPDSNGGFIDVRDVARAHIAAFNSKETDGKRLFLFESRYTGQVIINSLREHFPELRSTLPVGDPNNTDTQAAFTNDNSATKKLLGYKFKSLDESIYDTVVQYLSMN